MKNAELLRRAVHLLYPISLAYYLFPPDSWIGVASEILVVVVVVGFLVFEAYRLTRKVELPMIRHYERRRAGAYIFGIVGIGLGLLFFPMPITIVAVCGMAWIDPLCHATKKRSLYPVVPLIAYFFLALALLFVFSNYSAAFAAALAVVGTVSAIAAERPSLKMIDDDFTMVIVPLLVLGAIDLLF